MIVIVNLTRLIFKFSWIFIIEFVFFFVHYLLDFIFIIYLWNSIINLLQSSTYIFYKLRLLYLYYLSLTIYHDQQEQSNRRYQFSMSKYFMYWDQYWSPFLCLDSVVLVVKYFDAYFLCFINKLKLDSLFC